MPVLSCSIPILGMKSGRGKERYLVILEDTPIKRTRRELSINMVIRRSIRQK